MLCWGENESKQCKQAPVKFRGSSLASCLKQSEQQQSSEWFSDFSAGSNRAGSLILWVFPFWPWQFSGGTLSPVGKVSVMTFSHFLSLFVARFAMTSPAFLGFKARWFGFLKLLTVAGSLQKELANKSCAKCGKNTTYTGDLEELNVTSGSMRTSLMTACVRNGGWKCHIRSHLAENRDHIRCTSFRDSSCRKKKSAHSKIWLLLAKT